MCLLATRRMFLCEFVVFRTTLKFSSVFSVYCTFFLCDHLQRWQVYDDQCFKIWFSRFCSVLQIGDMTFLMLWPVVLFLSLFYTTKFMTERIIWPLLKMKPDRRREVLEDMESSTKFGTQWNSERTADKQSLCLAFCPISLLTHRHTRALNHGRKTQISVQLSL